MLDKWYARNAHVHVGDKYRERRRRRRVGDIGDSGGVTDLLESEQFGRTSIFGDDQLSV